MALSGNFLERVGRYPRLARDLSALLQDVYRYEDHPVIARPVPQTPPSLWMLGTNVKSAQYAAELGTGYVFGQFMSDSDGVEILKAYREAFRPAFFQLRPQTILAVSVICAETEEQAQALVAKAEAAFSARSGLPFKGLAGTGEQVRAQLREMQSKYLNEEFLIVTSIPDYEYRLESYRLLVDCS